MPASTAPLLIIRQPVRHTGIPVGWRRGTRLAGDLSWRIGPTTLLRLEDELGRQRHAQQCDGQDLLRLNQQGHGDRLIPVETKGDGGRGIRGLKDADVAGRETEQEAEVHEKQCSDRRDRGHREVGGTRRHLVRRDLKSPGEDAEQQRGDETRPARHRGDSSDEA